MSKAHAPELKKFMDKRVGVKMNGGRYVHGVLRGYDPFMNIVIDRTTEELKEGSETIHNSIGMVVVRGNSIIQLEALENL